MPSRSKGMPSRREGPPSIWDTHGKSGDVFAHPDASSTAPYPQELNQWSSPIEEPLHSSSGEKWKAKSRSGSEMAVWTVSQKFSNLQWRRLFEELWRRPTTTADFVFSFRQNPYTSDLCFQEDNIQDWSMYVFTNTYGSYAMDERSGDGSVSGWFKIFVINKRFFNAEFWSTWCEDCFSRWTKSSIMFQFKRRISLEERKGPEGRPDPSQLDLRILLPGRWNPRFCRELRRPLHCRSTKWRYSGMRFKVERNFIINGKIPPDDILEGLSKFRIRRVW